MICGRCKAVGVAVEHVRACYRTPSAQADTPARVPAPTADEKVVSRPDQGPSRGHRRRENPWTWQPVVGPVESAIERGGDPDGFGGEMDADGGTPRLRALESEFGFEAMLYMWRDDEPGDEAQTP